MQLSCVSCHNVGMSDRCDFKKLMAAKGMRATPLRLEVLSVMSDSRHAMTAQEVLEAVMARGKVNRVTVYRILEDLIRVGIMRRLSLEGKSSRFELACEHHPPHPHFQCEKCGQVQCLEPVPMERLWSELRGPLGNEADRIEIRVAGICPRCRGVLL